MKNIKMILAVLTAFLCGGMLMAQEPLFKCVFESQADFDAKWTQTSTRDNNTWRVRTMVEMSSDQGSKYCAEVWYFGEDEGVDYMVTKNPVTLTAGGACISHWWMTFTDPETYSVWYGKTADPSHMTLLKKYENVSNPQIDGVGTWLNELINFDVEEAGDYYFAFGYHSVDMSRLFIDDVEVFDEKIVGSPDFKVADIKLPLSSCALGVETMDVTLENNGSAAAGQVKITCLVNGIKAWDTVVEKTLDIQQSVTLTKIGKVDMTDTGRYIITVIASDVDAEPVDDENAAKAYLQHWSPIALPFYSDFGDTDTYLNWAVEGSTWEYYPDFNFVMSNGYGALYSRCMTFEAGHIYRFATTFLCGLEGVGGDFDVVYGVPGTDYRTWDTIISCRNFWTDDEAQSRYIDFEAKKSGDMSVAIVGYGARYLYFHNIRISEVDPYDVKIYQYDPIPTQMPVDQINSEFTILGVAENEGLVSIDSVILSVIFDSVTVGSATYDLGEPGYYVIGEIPVKASDLKTGDSINLRMTVEIKDRVDGYPDDNEISQGVLVTDSVFAFDWAVDSLCDSRYGFGGPKTMIGAPIQIFVEDTLTAIRIFWTASKAFDFPLSLWRFDDVNEKLTDLLYTGTFHKDTVKGVVTYPINPMLIAPGYYMVTVTVDDNCLVTDHEASGILYTYVRDEFVSQEGYGYAAVRPIFGHFGEVYAKDVAVDAVVKPRDRQVLTENQPIEVAVSNYGYQAASFTVKVKVNDNEPETRQVSLNAYSKTTLTFKYNMAEVGTYKIVASVEMAGDERETNNTVEKTVECIASADPYIMNFENCEDFAVDGFNPAWQSVDMDGRHTYNFFWSYPGMGQPMGFITMNDAALIGEDGEVMDAADIAHYGLGACEGHKFGASVWALDAGQNDDWLISPLLALDAEAPVVTFMAKSYDAYYGGDVYQVLVSKTGEIDLDAEENYGFILLAEDTVYEEWTKVTVDLSEYKDRNMSVAIRCVSHDQYMFMIDDIRVGKADVANEKNKEDVSLRLYPNPAHEAVVIKSDGAVIEQVSIFNVAGREIFASSNASRTEFRYNVSGLQQGMYFARVKTAQGTSVLKFVVK